MDKHWAWMLLVLALAGGTAACSASQGDPSAPASSPPSASPNTVAARTGARSSKTALPIPNYQPSKVIMQTIGGVQLSSMDSVSKVASFYENALKSGKWRIISIDKNATSTNLVAMRGTLGVGISISRAGPVGTSIVVAKCQC